MNEFEKNLEKSQILEKIIENEPQSAEGYILFEKLISLGAITEKDLVSYLNGENMDESILGRVLGGMGGYAVGVAVGKAICSVLGLSEGPLYDMLTSKIVAIAVGSEIGNRIL